MLPAKYADENRAKIAFLASFFSRIHSEKFSGALNAQEFTII